MITIVCATSVALYFVGRKHAFWWVVWPGTVAHELMHWAVGLVLLAKPGQFSVWPKESIPGQPRVIGEVSFYDMGWFNTLPVAIAPLFSVPLVFANIHHFHFKNTWIYIAIVWLLASVLSQSLPSPTDWRIAKSRLWGAVFWIVVVTTAIFIMTSEEKYNWHKLFGAANQSISISNTQKSINKNPVVQDNSAFAPSFDCRKVTNRAERLICRDRDLSELDVKLNAAYLKARDSVPDQNHLRIGQSEWLIKTRNSCTHKGCMVAVMEKRIDELDTWKLKDVVYFIKQKAINLFYSLFKTGTYYWHWAFGG